MRTSIVLAAALMSVLASIQPATSVAAEPATPPAADSGDLKYGPPITAEQAKRVLAAAETEARRLHAEMSIAVVEPSGELVAFIKMDDARYGTSPVALAYAKMAALFRRSTKSYTEQYKRGDTAFTTLPNMLVGEGGMPIVFNGQIVGAIGVAGGPNAAVSSAGADALK
jgi:glc operon protein GlcG